MKILLVTLLAMFLLGCDNKPEATDAVDSVKHSYNTYEAQYDEKPKMSSSGVGIIFDQKTGDTVAIMYKGKSYYP